MDGIATFFAMGGYGGFVWSAFGMTALVLVGLLIISIRQARGREQRLAALQAQLGGRARRDRS